MHQHLVKLLGADTADIHLVDGFPMDVCVTTRAKNSTVYKGEAAYGYCTAKKKGVVPLERRFGPENQEAEPQEDRKRRPFYGVIESPKT